MINNLPVIPLSAVCYEEIRDKLFESEATCPSIDFGKPSEILILGEIGFRPLKGCQMPSHHWTCRCDGSGGDR